MVVGGVVRGADGLFCGADAALHGVRRGLVRRCSRVKRRAIGAVFMQVLCIIRRRGALYSRIYECGAQMCMVVDIRR